VAAKSAKRICAASNLTRPVTPKRSSWSADRGEASTAIVSGIVVRAGPVLWNYFRSGWAFFVPYFAAYMLYSWMKWPANPAGASSARIFDPPCLLTVYRILHGIHVVTAASALIWWRRERQIGQNNRLSRGDDEGPGLLPWLGLALIFLIPGTYLEWPSDPVEHFRRITEWAVHPTIEAHSAGYKSFYFFAYSFLADANPRVQLVLLRAYLSGISLTLAWQYFRLGIAVGLNRRWSFVFVVLHTCLFGNIGFSFDRYYGLSSSMYAQIGAVALCNLVVSWWSHRVGTGSGADSLDCWWSWRVLPVRTTMFLVLGAFIAANHVQGLGIAGLSVASIATARFLQGGRQRLILALASVTTACIAVVLWWPRDPAVDSLYRPNGWLSAWYGFNLAWWTPAGDRAWQMIGALGGLNLIAGLIQMRRNPLIGWLTLGPIVALALPVVALPLANQLAARSVNEIIVFHRMLFAIPSGLALAGLADQMASAQWAKSIAATVRAPAVYVSGLAMLILVLVGPSRPFYNRFWHLLAVTPSDLELRSVVNNVDAPDFGRQLRPGDPLIAPDPIAFVLNTSAPQRFPFRDRRIGVSQVSALENAVALMTSSGPFDSASRPMLIQNPETRGPSAWTIAASAAPEFVSFATNAVALQNPPGKESEILTAELCPIDPTRTYFVEMTARQGGTTAGTAYLGVAWYSKNGELLIANAPPPRGAGAPDGWANGTYSYFGLVNREATRPWTTYRFSFGADGSAAIPKAACFVRLGALLNYHAAPDAVIQLTNILLWEKGGKNAVAEGAFTSGLHYDLIVPSPLSLFSPGSQAAEMSNHWPSQQLATDIAGAAELEAAARDSGKAVVTVLRLPCDRPTATPAMLPGSP